MRIYYSIFLSGMILVGAIGLYKPTGDRSSLSVDAMSQIQHLADGQNSNNACSRGASREECSFDYYLQALEPVQTTGRIG